ncbi:RuvC family protein [Sulfitobacter guttiformis]|uniref:Uncharacterized protein n=1 Tax=Sulfitobacter guttiformis TaxID=74349 RepID=A0A420DHB5_9RHOB|nr:hypothetical protein [Sulfitobacter guttiformis]KIN72662.1 crossover junction endodeoxyribonuclease RuvC [Sulfitobacter guttiformis KCTC 32187]RKE93609.1 hypothetical protein C8N30_2686 [Sulfitobacter guttiformis]
MRVVGIDPGFSGALACIDPVTDEVIGLEDMPTGYSGDVKVVCPLSIYGLLKRWQPDVIILEKVGPRHTDKRSSMWKFAQGYGAVIAACQLYANRPSLHLVAPGVWKVPFGLILGAGVTDADKKRASLEMARQIFPDVAGEQLKRQMDDGRAEALLVAAYYQRALAAADEMEVI